MNGSDLPLAFVVVQAVLSAVLLTVGAWGRREAANLPPSHLSEEERAHRARVMARGSIACQVAGWILALTVLWFAMDRLL